MTIGEMKKAIGEMENEISMALRSSDHQIGFEIICKKLSKLEKENEELNEIRNGQARIINNDTDRIEKLKKENEQLKKDKERLSKRNEILTNIIMDAFKLNVDLCPLCKSKGEYLPDCECLTDEACLKKLIGLYGD